MDEIIIHTKIIPEKDTSRLLPRPHLLDLLKENSGKKLIVVSAGAGYGKTTLVKQFLLPGDLKYAWYKIDETDNSLFTFLSYLIHSISNTIPEFGNSSREILESIRNRDGASPKTASVVSTVCGTIVNELSKTIQDDLYIVLDDFHLFPDSEWVEPVMSYLVEYLPQNIHMVITTREKLPFDVSKLKAKRKYFEINDELKFSNDEIKKLASSEYKVSIDDSDLPVINKFDGWITGLHLYMQGNKEKTSEFLKQDMLPDNLYNFFAEDIYSSESEEVGDFLLRSSALENFTAGECNDLFEIEDSNKILDDLHSGNVFIQRSDIIKDGQSKQVYNYQSLFRDFLRSKLNEQINETGRREIYNRIAKYFLSQEDYPGTIKYYLLAQEYERGLELIKEYFEKTSGSVGFSVMESWINQFPGKMKSGNPFLTFYRGNVEELLYGNSESALDLFKSSSALFKESGEINFFVKSVIWISHLLINQGKNEDAISLIESTLKEKISASDKAKLLYRLGIAHTNLLSYERALEVFQEALEISNVEEINEIKYSLLNDLGNIHLVRGEYEKAIFYYESVITNISNVYKKFQTIANAIQVYSYAGNFDKALDLFKDAEDFVKKYSSQYFKINFLLSSAYLSYMLCEYENAIKTWKELISLSLDSGLAYYIYIGNLNIGICSYYAKDYNASNEYYDIALELSKDFDEGEKTYLDYWRSLLRKESETDASTEKDISKALKYYTDKSMSYEKVHSVYHLADYYIRSGNKKKAVEYIREAFDEGEKKKFITLFQKEFIFNRTVFDVAAEEKIGRDFIDSIIANVSSSGDSQVYDISLSVLGEMKLFIRGKEIPDDKWVRKIRKLIFAYILLNKKSLTKDSLIDLFYPDSEPENANSVFHQTLSNIRSIFKWAISGEKDKKQNVPEFIMYENQRLTLNPNYIYYIDAFEFENLYKKGNAAGVSEKSKLEYFENALDLYKGEFLEGYYQPWCEELREKYTNFYFSILDSVIEIYKEAQNNEKLAEYSRKLIKADNLNEDAYLNVIEAELAMNFPEKAKDVYKAMLKTFKKGLGEEPSPGTLKKAKKLFGNRSIPI
jgi:LuxR family maltose regulon positive regulatory protein